jgi:signal recognition particle GTPase
MIMANVKSNHDGPLGLPMGGPVIEPGKTVHVERWGLIKEHDVVKSWLAAEVIEVVDEDDDDFLDELNGDSIDADADADAAKDELIAQLAEFGIKKTRRSSLESLKEALDEALEAATDPENE